jgi:hypothetical protein
MKQYVTMLYQIFAVSSQKKLIEGICVDTYMDRHPLRRRVLLAISGRCFRTSETHVSYFFCLCESLRILPTKMKRSGIVDYTLKMV